jgi:hypothetical protein
LTGGRCSEVALVQSLLGRVLGWSLLAGGRYSEVVVSTSLTVFIFVKGFMTYTERNNFSQSIANTER